MEDAMVLNKASVERGFAHGSIYRGRVGNALSDDLGTSWHCFPIHRHQSIEGLMLLV